MKNILILGMLITNALTFSQHNLAQYYFPLHVGNRWQYREDSNTFRESRVIKDSIMTNNKKYFVINGMYFNGYYRTEESKVYLFHPAIKNSEAVFFDFSLNIGDTVSRVEYPGTTHVITFNSKGVIQILGQKYEYIRFFRDDVKSNDDGYYYLVNGLGLVAYVGELLGYECSGAIIDGKQYGIIVSMNHFERNVPAQFSLSQNYPNPFNPETTIKYSIPSNVKGESINATLKVYDLLGREVATLVEGIKSPGRYEVKFDKRHASMKLSMTSGIYFYRLQCGNYSETKKLVLMK